MRALRFLTAGESHGPALTVILEGLPAGLAIDTEALAAFMRRRREGYGRGARMAIEDDAVRILGGVRHGRTIGSPIALQVENRDHEKWREAMSAEPVSTETIKTAFRMAEPPGAGIAPSGMIAVTARSSTNGSAGLRRDRLYVGNFAGDTSMTRLDARAPAVCLDGRGGAADGPSARGPVGIDRLGGCDEPRVVLAQTAGRSALEQRASPRLCQVESVNREALQRGQCRDGAGAVDQRANHVRLRDLAASCPA